MNQKNVRNLRWWWPALAILILIRLFAFFLTPPFDSDSIDILLGARNVLENNEIPASYTLPILLAAGLNLLFGEHLLLDRSIQFLSGLICMFLLLEYRRQDNETGPISAIIFGSLPITILFGSIGKPYLLMTVLILGGAFCFHRAIEQERHRIGAATAWLFASAFLCHAFAIIAIFPIVVLAFLSALSRRRASNSKLFAWTLVPYLLLMAPVLLWRYRLLGWGLFGDYEMGWGFELQTTMYRGTWIGLTDFWATGVAVLVPGMVVVLHRPAIIRQLGTLGAYGVLFTLMNILVWIANPVHHSPRILMPSLPFLCLLAGAAVYRLGEKPRDLPVTWAWLLTTLVALVWLYPRRNDGSFAIFSPETFQGIVLTALLFGVGFLSLLSLIPLFRKLNFQRSWFAPAALALTAVAFGPLLARHYLAFLALVVLVLILLVLSSLKDPFGFVRSSRLLHPPLLICVVALALGAVMTWPILDNHARAFNAKLELIREASVRNLAGGSNFQSLISPGPQSVANLFELMWDEKGAFFEEGFVETCRQRKISHVIVSFEDLERLRPVYADFALRQGWRITDVGRLFRSLEVPEAATRWMHNDYGTLYILEGVEPVPLPAEEKGRFARYVNRFMHLPLPGASLSFTKVPGDVAVADSQSRTGSFVKAQLGIRDAWETLGEKPIEATSTRLSWPRVFDHPGAHWVVELRDAKDPLHRIISMRIPPNNPTL